MTELETEIGPQEAAAFLLYRPNVVNKEITYSDEIINYNDNTKVTPIYNVGAYSFEYCLKTILNSNSNVIFKNIQYSKEKKIIYFYTDNDISIEAWNKLNDLERPYYSLYCAQVDEDIKNLLKSKQPHPEDTISLLSALELSKKVYDEIEQIKKNCFYKINIKIKNYFSPSHYNSENYYAFEDKDFFDFFYKEMAICFKIKEEFNARFVKKENELIISQCRNEYYKDIILPLIGKELSELYDIILKCKSFYMYISNTVAPINAQFRASINYEGVVLYTYNIFGFSKKYILNNFYLKFSNNDNKKPFKLNCYDADRKNESNLLPQLLEGRERDLFDKIYIKVDDCPKWMIQIIYNEKEKKEIIKGLERIEQLKLTEELQQYIIEKENIEAEQGLDKPKKNLKQRVLSLFKR